MRTLPALVADWVVVLFMAGFGALILYRMFVGQIDLSDLLTEMPDPKQPNVPGKASLSRVQLLLFIFIIGGIYLTICMESGQFMEIPNQVLGLLGISAGSYVVSKGISNSNTPTTTTMTTTPAGITVTKTPADPT
jgi:hypothetical protein